jgi:type III secretion protein S
MTHSPDFASILYDALNDAVIFAAPPLILATVVAFLVGLFQAVTQIQEQTLPQTIKIVVIVLTLMYFGGVLALPLYQTTSELFNTFGSKVR